MVKTHGFPVKIFPNKSIQRSHGATCVGIQVTTGMALEVCEFHVVGRDAVADDGPGSKKTHMAPWPWSKAVRKAMGFHGFNGIMQYYG